MRFTSIKVAPEFPMRTGELIRIRLPQSGEIRVRVLGSKEGSKGGDFHAESYYHSVPNNKERITLIGNERKLRRV